MCIAFLEMGQFRSRLLSGIYQNVIENNFDENYIEHELVFNCITSKEVHVVALILCDLKHDRTV